MDNLVDARKKVLEGILAELQGYVPEEKVSSLIVKFGDWVARDEDQMVWLQRLKEVRPDLLGSGFDAVRESVDL